MRRFEVGILTACVMACTIAAAPVAPAAAARVSAVVLGPGGARDPAFPALLAESSRDIGAASDGHGGWFVAGWFDRVGTATRYDLVHVLSSGRVDPRWHPQLLAPSPDPYATPPAIPVALAAGDGEVYVALEPDDGPDRLVAFDARTGALDRAFDPPPAARARSFVTQVVFGAGQLFVLGRDLGGPHPGIGEALVALNAHTGRPEWAKDGEHVDSDYTTAAVCGTRLYLAGAVHAGRRSLPEALNPATGRRDAAWQPPPRLVPQPYGAATVACNAQAVFLGGYAGAARRSLIAVDPASGRLRPAFRPRLTGRGSEADGLAVAGSRVYVVGALSRVGGRPATAFAAVDAETGARLPAWSSPTAETDFGLSPAGGPSTIAASGDRVLIGGDFPAR